VAKDEYVVKNKTKETVKFYALYKWIYLTGGEKVVTKFPPKENYMFEVKLLTDDVIEKYDKKPKQDEKKKLDEIKEEKENGGK